MIRTPLIEVAHCDVVLADRKALDDVSFTLRAGERWALIGANGAGKTLLLKLLRGDVWPTPSGRESRAWLHEGEVQSQPPAPGERLPYVGPERQDRYERYDWNFTVREIVATGLFDEDYPLTHPTRLQRVRVTRVLSRFGLEALTRRRFLTLSYGERRLCMVARAFAKDAPVVLLDEVFNGLDVRTRKRLLNAFERPGLRAAWVLSAHRDRDVPGTTTHVLRLESGRVVEQRRLKSGETLRTRHFDRSMASTARPIPRRALTAPGTSETLLRISHADVYQAYRPVLRDLDWEVRAREHWAIVGPNGAGKSTLLRLIYGDCHPALGGTIERRGHPRGTPIEDWKRRIGFVSPELQTGHAHAGTLEEVVVSGLRPSVGLDSPPTPSERRRARHWLRFFAIDAKAQRTTREVSYGQLRLALLARAMIGEPELLLLDEPCTGLDAARRAQVSELLERVAETGVQIIMAVHHLEDLIPSITHVLEIRRSGRVRLSPREAAVQLSGRRVAARQGEH